MPQSGGRASAAAPWRLSRPALERLLAALDADPARAAEKYESLHCRLGRFFRWNRCDQPEALADEVLDRLARRLVAEHGEAGAVARPEVFALGIARLVVREQWRRSARREEALRDLQREVEAEGGGEALERERLSALLERCLAELPAEQRDLIRRYYGVEGRRQMDARRELASELGISANALRNRALRIRAELERAARARAAEGDAS